MWTPINLQVKKLLLSAFKPTSALGSDHVFIIQILQPVFSVLLRNDLIFASNISIRF